MNFRPLIIIILIVASFQVSGQNTGEKERRFKTPEVSLSYFGEQVVNPGVKVGLQLPVYNSIKEKKDAKVRAYTFLVGAQAAYYYHQGSYEMLFGGINLGIRHTSYSGIFKEIAFGGGVFKTILPAPVYKVSQGNDIEKKEKGGTYYGGVVTTIRLGYDFGHRKQVQVPISIFCGLSVFDYGPHKFDFLPYYATEAGVIYKLNLLSRTEI